jgi:glycosyltransferase involved in cell wall biosynthesis
VDAPDVSIVIPTRYRPAYLEVALASLMRQDLDRPYEVVVVDDGSTDATASVVSAHGATYIRHERPRGPNAARNTGIHATAAPLIVFLDDDVEAPPGWLRAVVEGAGRYADAEAFGGPIRARFEGPTPRSCGREKPPITTLDLGCDDLEVQMVWSANLAVRRGAFERVGPFDEAIVMPGGDEEEWLLALHGAGGRIVYLANAGLDHRRAGRDARLPALARASYHRGRALRLSDERLGKAPPRMRELRTLAGCLLHTVHYACPQGPIMAAHSAGRLVQAVRGGRS